MFVWGGGGFVPLPLNCKRHHFRFRAANFDLYSALMAHKQCVFFNVPHLLSHGPTPYYMVISEDLFRQGIESRSRACEANALHKSVLSYQKWIHFDDIVLVKHVVTLCHKLKRKLREKSHFSKVCLIATTRIVPFARTTLRKFKIYQPEAIQAAVNPNLERTVTVR